VTQPSSQSLIRWFVAARRAREATRDRPPGERLCAPRALGAAPFGTIPPGRRVPCGATTDCAARFGPVQTFRTDLFLIWQVFSTALSRSGRGRYGWYGRSGAEPRPWTWKPRDDCWSSVTDDWGDPRHLCSEDPSWLSRGRAGAHRTRRRRRLGRDGSGGDQVARLRQVAVHDLTDQFGRGLPRDQQTCGFLLRDLSDRPGIGRVDLLTHVADVENETAVRQPRPGVARRVTPRPNSLPRRRPRADPASPRSATARRSGQGIRGRGHLAVLPGQVGAVSALQPSLRVASQPRLHLPSPDRGGAAAVARDERVAVPPGVP
jgi:hypothetical protein